MNAHPGSQARDAAPDPFAKLTLGDVPAGRPEAEVWEPRSPAPGDPILPRRAVTIWTYRDAHGRPLCARVRFDRDDGGKDILPYTYGRRVWTDRSDVRQDVTGWHFKEPGKPLPLYGLDRLAAAPEAPVLLVEGEKTADAAAELFPDHVVITSQGGSKAPSRSDWSPLARRVVTIWPDADDAGIGYAEAVIPLLREAGASFVRRVTLPFDLPKGWDLADELPLPLAGGDDRAALRAILEEAGPASSNVKMPDGFRMTARGLFFQPEAKGEGEPPPRVFVAAPFDIVAETNDGGGLGWGLLLRWLDRDGRVHEWAVPRRLIHGDGRELAGELEDAGLSCSVSGVTRLRQFIGSVRTDRRLRCVERTGWHKTDGGHVFILPGGHTFGGGATNVVFQSTRAATGRDFAASGTLEDWKREVAALTIGNSRLALFLAASFAGPLLDVAGEQSGGLHLVGKSQSGKSTAALIAGSVWGRGDRDGQVRQWRGTANGIEGIASETSDTVLILDEMGQAEAREIGEIVYMLSNSSGKQRAGRGGEARQRKSWRTLFLSTGELTLSAKLAEAGKKVMAGQEVRLVNLPADAGAKMGVFEKLHGKASARELAEHFRDAARRHYGTASRAFLTALVHDRTKDLDGLLLVLKEMREGFVAEFVPQGADGQVGSVATRFALIAAAGELAIHYCVLPWPRGEARRAAAECFRAWLGLRGSVTAGEDEQALAQVRGFIEAHGESRFTVLGAAPLNALGQPIESRTINRVGFRERIGAGDAERWDYLILPEAWRNEVCKGLDAEAAAKVLVDRDLLRRDPDQRLTIKRSLPDHGRIRVYVIKGDILGGGVA